MQYCMASPRHFLQSTKYNNLTSIRASSDRLTKDRWQDFLFTSKLAGALGVWPFADNFMSTETDNLLVATLSAGPIGIGDSSGTISGANLLHAVRRDGVIVKPDAPLTPIDSSFVHVANGTNSPLIAATYSDFGGLRTNYVFAFTKGSQLQASFAPAEIGITGPSYLYDYFGHAGEVVNPADVVTKKISGDSLFLVLAPIGPSGIAVLGDLGQFVTMGKMRVPAISDDGTVQMAVAFSSGETRRVIQGYAPFRPEARASVGAIGPVLYDAASHRFQVAVMPGADGGAAISLRKAGAHSPTVPAPDPER
jgi:hypothetical protein